MKRKIAIGLFVVLAVLLTACPKQDVVHKLAVASRESSAAIKAFQENEIQLYKAGLISKDDHLATQQILLDVAQVGLTLDQQLRVAQRDTDALTAVKTAIAGLDTITTQIGIRIKDESTRTKFLIAVTGVRSALSTISAILEGGQNAGSN